MIRGFFILILDLFPSFETTFVSSSENWCNSNLVKGPSCVFAHRSVAIYFSLIPQFASHFAMSLPSPSHKQDRITVIKSFKGSSNAWSCNNRHLFCNLVCGGIIIAGKRHHVVSSPSLTISLPNPFPSASLLLFYLILISFFLWKRRGKNLLMAENLSLKSFRPTWK